MRGRRQSRDAAGSLLRAWQPDPGLGPFAIAERSLLLAAAFVRLTGALQIALAIKVIAETARYPIGSVTVAVVFIVQSLVIIGLSLVRGHVSPPSLAMADAAFGLFILIQPVFLGSHSPVGSWGQWQFAAGMAVACYVALSLDNGRQLALLAGLNATAYLIGVHFGPVEGEITSAYVNTAAFICLVPAAYVVASYLRSLAQQLGLARELNARLAAEAAIAQERAAQRIMLHDTAGLLAMLGKNVDPEFDQVLRAQAQTISRDLRQRVYGDQKISSPRTLHDLVASTTSAYGDLPISSNTLLAKRLHLTDSAHATVSAALRTLLDNVRQHARASSVTIHASSSDDGWTLLIRDDGVGFSTDQPLGFGLTEQVVQQCALLGIEVDIESEPGAGTAVEMRGPAATLRGE